MSAISFKKLVAHQSCVAISVDLQIRELIGHLLVGIIEVWFFRRGDSVGFWSTVEVPKQDQQGTSAIVKIILESVGHCGAVETGYSRELLLNFNQLLLIGIVSLLCNGDDAEG